MPVGSCGHGRAHPAADRRISSVPRVLVKTLIEVNCSAVRHRDGRFQAGQSGQKKTLEARLTTEIAAEVEDLIGESGRLTDIDFEALERAARRQALEIAAMSRGPARLNADHTDQAGSTLSCACGTCGRLRGPAAKDASPRRWER